MQKLNADNGSQVEEASGRVEQELNAAFAAVHLPTLAKMPAKLRPSIVHDRANNAVWIKIPKGSPVRDPVRHKPCKTSVTCCHCQAFVETDTQNLPRWV